MLSYSLTIPKNGTIVIPKEIRNLLHTSNITIQVDKDNNISIVPVRELRGRLSKYSKNVKTNSDGYEIAWDIYLKDKYSKADD